MTCALSQGPRGALQVQTTTKHKRKINQVLVVLRSRELYTLGVHSGTYPECDQNNQVLIYGRPRVHALPQDPHGFLQSEKTTRQIKTGCKDLSCLV